MKTKAPITQENLKDFEKWLRRKDFSDHTISSYTWTMNYFKKNYGVVNSDNVIDYKNYLMDNCKLGTVNLRLRAIHSYCDFSKDRDTVIKYVKNQRKPFIDHVVSNADYKYLKMRLKRDKEYKWYYIFWFMSATGARVSEVVRVKAENVYDGYMDLYSKGQKLRRIYIPVHLQKELLDYINKEKIGRGSFLWLNKNGETLDVGGIEKMCKVFAEKYGLDPDDIYPHSFRHRFAMNFLEASNNDIVTLADLLGHSSIETTRIYLRKTAQEQRNMVNKLVNW